MRVQFPPPVFDSERQGTSNPVSDNGLVQSESADPGGPSRLFATEADPSCPWTATRNATHRVAACDDLPPDLALVIERWDALPESAREAVVALVKASGEPEPTTGS